MIRFYSNTHIPEAHPSDFSIYDMVKCQCGRVVEEVVYDEFDVPHCKRCANEEAYERMMKILSDKYNDSDVRFIDKWLETK